MFMLCLRLQHLVPMLRLSQLLLEQLDVLLVLCLLVPEAMLGLLVENCEFLGGAVALLGEAHLHTFLLYLVEVAQLG